MSETAPTSHTIIETTVLCPQCKSRTTDVTLISGQPGERVAIVTSIPCEGCPVMLTVPIDALLK